MSNSNLQKRFKNSKYEDSKSRGGMVDEKQYNWLFSSTETNDSINSHKRSKSQNSNYPNLANYPAPTLPSKKGQSRERVGTKGQDGMINTSIDKLN